MKLDVRPDITTLLMSDAVLRGMAIDKAEVICDATRVSLAAELISRGAVTRPRALAQNGHSELRRESAARFVEENPPLDCVAKRHEVRCWAT